MDALDVGSQVAALRDRYRCISWDERGHGQTESDGRSFTYWDSAGDLLALLEHLGVRRATSSGCPRAAISPAGGRAGAGAREALVFVASSARREDPDKEGLYHAMLETWERDGLRPELAQAIATIVLGADWDGSAAWIEKWQRMDVSSLRGTLEPLFSREDFTSRLGELDHPALVIWGDQDAAVSGEHARGGRRSAARIVHGRAGRRPRREPHPPRRDQPRADVVSRRGRDAVVTAPLEPPAAIAATLRALDEFIETEIRPLELSGDNARFFDHRREWARTDFERDGLPSPSGRSSSARCAAGPTWRAGCAGASRTPRRATARRTSRWPSSASTSPAAVSACTTMRSTRARSSATSPSSSCSTPWRRRPARRVDRADGHGRAAGGDRATEPGYGSDAMRMEARAVADGGDWVINARKRWNSAAHAVSHNVVFARTSGEPGEPLGITAFLVPTDAPGYTVEFFWWTMNLPPTPPRSPSATCASGVGRARRGRRRARRRPHFVHDQRMRQAAQSLGAAQYCIDGAVAYARARHTWGRRLSSNQAIQFPLAELHTEAAMVRALVRATAAVLDERSATSASHLVAMCNYRANRLACDAADQAIQVCGGVGYSRHLPFEHIYRRHRRYGSPRAPRRSRYARSPSSSSRTATSPDRMPRSSGRVTSRRGRSLRPRADSRGWRAAADRGRRRAAPRGRPRAAHR